MSRDRSADSTHVAFAMAIRRVELQYGLFLHTSKEWVSISSFRPPNDSGVFAALEPPELAAAVEREVDAEPRYPRLLPS